MGLLRLALTVLFFPEDTFYIVKRERSRSYLFPSMIIIASLLFTRILYVSFLNYPVSPYNLATKNLLADVGLYAAVLLSWAIAAYAVSAVMDGATKPGESLFATSLSAMPLVALQLPIMLISQVLGRNEASILNVLQIVMWVWMIILLFYGVKQLNEYTFLKTIAVMIVSVLFILLLWCIIIMMIVFGKNLWNFLYGFFIEFSVAA